MRPIVFLIYSMSIQFLLVETTCAQLKNNSVLKINSRIAPVYINQSINDFSMIDSLISTKKIVILSEDTHGDGATENLRTEVIKYLIAKKGFKVLITESSLHETYFLNSAISDNVPIEQFIDNIHNGYFTRKPVVDLLRFIKDSVKEKSFFINGLDIEIQGGASWEKLIKEAEMYPEVLEFISKNKKVWGEFRERLIHGFGIGINNNIALRTYDIIKTCVYVIRTSIKNKPAPENVFKDKIWENLLSYSHWTLVRPYVAGRNNSYDAKEVSLFRSMRDSLMFENFKWLKQNIIKDQKTIVVVSAYHSQKNFKSEAGFAKYMSPSSMTFGEYLNKSEFKEQTATFAFIASIGQRGAEYTQIVCLPKMIPKSLEHFLFNRNISHAFVNLKDLDFSFYMAPLHYSSYIKANWSKIFDGVFYNRAMYPNYRYK